MSTVSTLNDNFLTNLRAAMKRLKWSQYRLADESGVHYVTISRILNGHHDVTTEVAEKLANAVGIDPPKIFANPR